MLEHFKLDDKTINLEKINPLIRDILENVIIPRSRNKYSVDFSIQAINLALAHFSTMARLEYVPSTGNAKNTKMATYYAMSFLSSGLGKDFVTDLLEDELFKDLTEGFDKLISMKAKKHNVSTRDKMYQWLEEGEADDGRPYTKKEFDADSKMVFMPTTVEDIGLRFGIATPEGLAFARNRIVKIDVGSPSLKIPEFSSALSNPNIKELFTALIELWENGNMSAKTTKNDLLPACKNIPILFNAYTDPNKIINDTKKQKSLVEEFSSGMGRRTFIVYPDNEDLLVKSDRPINEIPEEVVNRITKPIANNIRPFFNIRSLEDWHKPIISFDDESSEYMYEVSKICMEKAEDLNGFVTDAEIANLNSMTAKIEKLASIYAFIDGRLRVNINDVKYATYWTTYTSKFLGKISKILTAPERLFLMAKKKNDWVSGFEIEQAGLFEKSFDFNKKLDSTLQNLNQLCALENYELLVSQRDGGAILKTRQIPLVDPNKLTTSFMMGDFDFVKTQAKGWRKAEFKWDTLHKFFCGDQQGAILASEVPEDETRTDDNSKGVIQFLALDFDDGSLTWEEMEKRFSNYTFFAYQSRNHQKEKNGKKVDRFRVILLLERELHLNKHQYSNMYKNIRAIIAPEADESTSNMSRLFFNSPNSDFIYNDGVPFKAHLFMEDNKAEKVYNAVTKLDGSNLKTWFLSQIDIVNAQRTGGVNLLVRACYASKDPMNMSSKEEAKAWIVELSKQIFDAYWKRHNLEKEVLGILDKLYE